MNVYCKFFYVIKISEISVILSYPWLHAINSRIDWKEQAWWYSINSEQVSIISPEKFALKMKKARQVFTIMLFSFIKTGQSAQVTLLRKLINFQNVVVTEKELMPSLHKLMMHYINTKNQKILYKPFYNLFSYRLKILHKYLDNTLAKN